MATEIGKETKLKLSIETIITFGFVLVTITGVYFTLEGKIAQAMELPKQDVTRTEFDLRIEAIGNQVLYNGKQLEEIKSTLEKVDQRLYDVSTK
tara:strand:- start:227 stop:508 length:282 start_codon:yes stop_codon:yes gene_type:complete